jgi:thiosulfate reductase cytochrome b subunit
MSKKDKMRPRGTSDSSVSERSSGEPLQQPIDSDDLPIAPKADDRRNISVEYQHSLATRWMHWINFPLLFLMIYSGILIYWADSQHEGLNAHRVYRIGIGDWTLFRLFPSWFYNSLHLKFQLAQGLAYHFFFMWFFVLNGIAYVLYTFLSGEWRNLVPNRHSFLGAFHNVRHDLGFSKSPLPRQKFNDAQRIAYTGVVLMGLGSLVTGYAIYKPTQLHIITSLLGGYEMARWFHFWLTLSYIGFFLIHVAQVIRAGWNNFRAMLIGYKIVSVESGTVDEDSSGQRTPRVEPSTVDEIHRHTRRSLLIAGTAAVIGGGLWRWLNDWSRIDGLSAPFRKLLDFNAAIARGLFDESALAPEFEKSKAVRAFRRNGDIGLSELKLEDWRLQLIGVEDAASYAQYSQDVTAWTYGMNPSNAEIPDTDIGHPVKKPVLHEDDAKGAAVRMKPMKMSEGIGLGIPGLLLTMVDVRKLPHLEMVTEFKCIEGWSEIVYWGGVHLRDFLATFPPHIGNPIPSHPAEFVNGLPRYIAFETSDGQYYVGIERQVALHPQTLLAYEMNGQPLSSDHGAPLRLVTPLKYGIKQIKQIGRITYTNQRPRDYWYEQGYDYYAGL